VAWLLTRDTEQPLNQPLLGKAPMIAAIAGASGFVGRALTTHLLGCGHDVIALGRSVGSVSTDARAIVVDVGDESATANALMGVDHLAP
jgi:nucleoside-diphosphate-sugar epimerase